MTDLDDFELGTADEPGTPPSPHRRRGLLVAIVAVAVIGGGTAAYLRWSRRPERPAATSATLAPPPASAATPAPSPAESATLPALDESDPLVRELVRTLTAHREVAVWLRGQGLLRAFVATVSNVAEGEPPRAHLPFLAPRGSFSVVERRGRTVIDPGSYARYDAFADVVDSVDAPAAAGAYRRLEPLFEAAYRELGHPEGGFSPVFGRALAVLEATPVVDGDIEVKPVRRAVVVYEMLDPRLEALAPAQKHLLRMGPRNLRRIKEKLRGLRDALGAGGDTGS
jgi:hypothetical protein